MCDLLYLASLTWHDGFEVHERCNIYRYFIPFYGCIMFHCTCIYFESNFLKIQNHSSFCKSQFLSPFPVVLHIPAPNHIFEINNGSTMILKTKKQSLS